MDVGNFNEALNSSVGFSISPLLTFWIAVLILWVLVWKGFALWKAGRKGHLAWFIAILVLNTAGILEILYIFVFSKMTDRLSSLPSRNIKAARIKPKKKRR